MNAAGRPHWFIVAETQTSDASHSTTNGWLSFMEWSVSLSSSFLSNSQANRADLSSGKDVAFTRGCILSEKFANHSTERANVCWRRIFLERAKSLLI